MGAGPTTGARQFTMLSDQPVALDEDWLGFGELADELCGLVLSSRDSTPFTLGIDAGWGMGKSSLLNLLKASLGASGGGDGAQAGKSAVRVIEFNPWSARDGRVLEGLTKQILHQVEDPLRRVLKSDRTRTGLKAVTRVAGRAVDAALLPLPIPNLGSGIVDALWDMVQRDPVARNQLRLIVRKAMLQWLADDPDRLLCVFIDDLDRCSPKSVFELFEAIKVHLDAPGLVYVIAYYGDVISKEIFKAEGYPEGVTSREYLEKIIQIIYRLPAQEEDRSAKLVDRYLAASRTKSLIGHLRFQLSRWSDGNPRRLKRIINTALVACDPDAPEDERAKSLATEVLAVYYPELAEPGSKGATRRDEFVAYATVRPILARNAQREELDPAQVETLDWVITHWDLPRGQTGPAMLQALDSLVGNFIELVWDARLVSLVETIAPLPADDREVGWDGVGTEVRDWRSEVTDEDARRVLAALLNPNHEFRTVQGLADEAAVNGDRVEQILAGYPQFVRRSPVPDKRDRPLFAARPALKVAAKDIETS